MPIWGIKGHGATTALNFSSSPLTIEAEKLIPFVHLRAFTQTSAGMLKSIQNFYGLGLANLAKPLVETINKGAKAMDSSFSIPDFSVAEDTLEVYKHLYTASDKVDGVSHEFYLPYLTEQHHTVGQNWDATQSTLPVEKQIRDFVLNTAKILTPAAGIVYPKSYAGVNNTGFTLSFVLVNTKMNEGSTGIPATLFNNLAFIRTIIRQNLHVQNNVLTVTPPCLYQALIPGVRFSPVCVVTSLEVLNKGNITPAAAFLGAGGVGSGGGQSNMMIPDAWEVNIQFQDLINESRAIYDASLNENLNGITVQIIDKSTQ